MQTKPDYLTQLIDEASKKAGNDNKLSKALEVNRSAVSDWRAGRKTCPAADQVLMAELAGFKAEEWAARALVAQYEGTSKGDKLFRALGKTLAPIGAVVASFGASARPIFSHDENSLLGYLMRCIEVLTLKSVRYRS
jgi:hypothetical protein